MARWYARARLSTRGTPIASPLRAPATDDHRNTTDGSARAYPTRRRRRRRTALASRLPLLVLGLAVPGRQHGRPVAAGCRVAPQRAPARPPAGLHAALAGRAGPDGCRGGGGR